MSVGLSDTAGAQQRQHETLYAQMCRERHVDSFEGRNEEFIQTMRFFVSRGDSLYLEQFSKRLFRCRQRRLQPYKR